MSSDRPHVELCINFSLALLTFYIQTWDEYHTHTLTLGVVSGPVEGVLTLVLVFAITGIKGGGSFWQQSMLATIGVGRYGFIPDTVYDLNWGEWYMVYGGLVLIFATGSRYASAVLCCLCHGTNTCTVSLTSWLFAANVKSLQLWPSMDSSPFSPPGS